MNGLSRGWASRSSRRGAGVIFAVGISLSVSGWTPAQQPDAAKKPQTTPPTAAIGTGKAASSENPNKPAVSEADALSFEQARVAAQMGELEERMYRLAQSLKEIEPANSARLMMALKAGREELVLQQMRDLEKLLTEMRLAQSITEQRVLLAKLQRLLDLLLSPDLDFQLMRERLKLMRSALERLDAAISEEERQRDQSRTVEGHAAGAAEQRKRLATLDELIRRQGEHLATGKKLAEEASPDDETRRSLGKLAEQQDETRSQAAALAKAAASAATGSVGQAAESMGQSAARLRKEQAGEAVPHQEKALEQLQQDRKYTLQELQRFEKQTAAQRFSTMRGDQQRNRQATDAIASDVGKLGESSAGAAQELARSGGRMSAAEEQLARKDAGEAAGRQEEALDSLRYARDQLQRAEQELKDQIHAEVRKRVLEALAQMLEQQKAVREGTEKLAGRAADKEASAVASVAGELAKSEAKIIEVNDSVIALVEETEFGIALHAALKAVRRGMADVQQRLAAGDVGSETVAAEQTIEADLAALLDAMQQMPSAAQRPGQQQSGRPSQRDQARELNRLAAEVKILRVLQVRVNHETLAVDGRRAGRQELAPEVRASVGLVEQHQDEVETATRKIAERLEQTP